MKFDLQSLFALMIGLLKVNTEKHSIYKIGNFINKDNIWLQMTKVIKSFNSIWNKIS